MSDIVERGRKWAQECHDLPDEQRMFTELCDEIERLRERLGPVGLEVIDIAGSGHYVNTVVKKEIERLRATFEETRERCAQTAEANDDYGSCGGIKHDIAAAIRSLAPKA